jgi:hypothetical protein
MRVWLRDAYPLETDAARAAREKTVVVSSSTKVLDLIAKMRQDTISSCVRLDGATKPDLRAGLVDRFQQDPNVSVFLLSTKAGGSLACSSPPLYLQVPPHCSIRCWSQSRCRQQTYLSRPLLEPVRRRSGVVCAPSHRVAVMVS